MGSVVAAYLAYRGDLLIGGMAVAEVAGGRPGMETALRAMRGTAAAYAVGYALLFLATVLGPYRRGDKSAWWAILVAVLAFTAVTLLRLPLLGLALPQAGTGAALIQGGLALLALLLDLRRVRD
jgi:uncharacterized membrane protein HdeD (DUF308 family)